MTGKQLIAAVIAVSLLAVGAVVAFFLLTSQPEENTNIVGTRDLTTEEISAVEIASSSFLQEAGNFGINMDTFTEETVSQRMQDIANDNGGTSWAKRATVASKLANERMDLSGGFRFNLDGISNADYTDGNRVASFRSGPMTLEVDPTGSYTYTDGEDPILLANVNFTGTSTLSHFSQSASAIPTDPGASENHDVESTPWDIQEQTVRISGTLTLSHSEASDSWKVRAIDFEEGEFAFPFWTPAQYTTSYPEIELGGTVVRTVNFPNSEEASNGSE